VTEVINLFEKSNILDHKKLETHQLIEVIEKYYTPGQCLKDKLTADKFKLYARQNPLLLPVNQEIDARKKRIAKRKQEIEEACNLRAQQECDGGQATEEVIAKAESDPESDDPEIEEDVRREREESELQKLEEDWRKQVISEHLVYIRGSEIVFFEFVEIIIDLADRFRNAVDPSTGKFRVILTKFIQDWLLRRLQSFVKFSIPTVKAGNDASRQWPDSAKDVEIKKLLIQKQREEEERKILMENRAREEAELSLMRREDENAMDPKEIEELLRKQREEEEAARRAREAAEEGGDHDEEEESDEDDDDHDDDDNSDADP